MTAKAPCAHGEIETDVVRATIRCRKCGASATIGLGDARYTIQDMERYAEQVYAGRIAAIESAVAEAVGVGAALSVATERAMRLTALLGGLARTATPRRGRVPS